MASPPKIAKSKNARWRAAVLILVHVVLALHIAHWMSAGSTVSPLEPSEAMEFSKHGLVNAGLIFFALTILSTLILGRWFCGWACHLVALQDLSLWILTKLGIKPKPMRSRLLVFVPIIAAAYMFVYPLAYRLWIGADVTTTQIAIYKDDFWATFPPWPVALLTFFVCGFATIYFLGAKGFCTYACPYGAFYGLADKLAVGRIRVTDACEGCGHCTATCSSNVVVHEEVRDHGMVVDPGCMKCLDCVSVCPMNALYFGLGKPALGTSAKPAARSRTSYTWGEELVLALAFLLALFVYRGLYGLVPFLLALAVAGIVATLFVAAARLFYRPSLSVAGWKVRVGGKLTGHGRVFAAGMVGLSALTAHSGFIQVHAKLSQQENDERALHHARVVDRFGLLDTPGNTAEMAQRLALLGRVDEALGLFDRALAKAPSASLFDRRAQLAFQSGRPEEGLETYQRATAWAPTDANLQYQLGVAAATLGRSKEAITAFEKAAELDPERVEAWENLGRGLTATGRPKEALRAQEEVLRLRPGDPEALQGLVGIYLSAGDPEGARARLRELEEAGKAPPELVQALLEAIESRR